ncbi:MAG TPA: hypothetical protein VF730_16390 [Terracidiphilus sp.]
MKYISILAGLALSIMPATLVAQYNPNPPNEPTPHTFNHGEIQLFGDYFRFSQVSPAINFVGLGGRVGFNASPHVALEANMSYDFSRNYTSTSTTGGSTSFSRTTLRPLSGLFGPKFQMGSSGPVRAFLTGKVGFVDFSRSSKVISGSTFTNAVKGVGGSSTYFAAYPGVGVEFFGGPIGFRLDAGDLLYLNNGVHNNIKISGGPAIRF